MSHRTSFFISFDDHLAFQLYAASQNERIKRKRTSGWIICVVFFAVLTVYFFNAENSFLGYYFLVATLLAAAFYPKYSAYLYKRHYEKYLKDVYRNNFDKEVVVSWDDQHLYSTGQEIESQVDLNEIQLLSETESYFFITLSSAQTLILPKSKLDDLELIGHELREIAKSRKIKFEEHLDWKWK